MVGGTDWLFVGAGIGALVLLSDVGDTIHEGGALGLIDGTSNDQESFWQWLGIGDGEGWL